MANTWLVTFALIAVIVSLIYKFLVWNFGYWSKRGIRETKSYPVCGSFPSAFTQKRHMVYDVNDVYQKYKNDENFVGMFMSRVPQLLILDHNYIQKIYVTDFKNFHDNEFSEFIDEKNDLILANNPFSIAGEKWKERRFEIIPGLTANRIKNAYPVTLEVCQRFTNYINHKSKNVDNEPIDTNELCLRFTSDVVTDCVLGLKAESLTDNPTPILGMIKKLFDQTFIFLVYQTLSGLIPGLKHFYKIRIFPGVVQNFFVKLMEESIERRRHEKVERIDFLNYLLQLQDKKNLTTSEMTSHVMTFLTDGFITTAFAISHCLLLLARDPTRQKKLREEVLQNLDENGYIDFERISEMPYLDACFYEALRIFPPLLFINKLCTIPYELKNKDGKTLQLNKGDIVIIPTYCLHHDENLYEHPDEFIPERFLPENGGIKKYQNEGKYLAFGNGPRICLGMRFAITQSKAAIVEVIKNFNVKVNPKTRLDNQLDKSQFIACLDGGIWLDFEAIK